MERYSDYIKRAKELKNFELPSPGHGFNVARHLVTLSDLHHIDGEPKVVAHDGHRVLGVVGATLVNRDHRDAALTIYAINEADRLRLERDILGDVQIEADTSGRIKLVKRPPSRPIPRLRSEK